MPEEVAALPLPFKFGRLAPHPRETHPRLIIDDYFLPEIPLPPATVDYASAVPSWPMYGNDKIGCCTCSAVGHMVQAWTQYANTELTVPLQSIIQLYSAVSGYNPVTGQNDNGANLQDVLGVWQKTGIPGTTPADKILLFAEISNISNLTFIQQCLWIFGTVYIGFDVPQSAMTQFSQGQPWTVVPTGTNIVGGHAIPIQLYDTANPNPIGAVTWAKLQQMSTGFFQTYCSGMQDGEAWVVISQDWLTSAGYTIAAAGGLDLYGLGQDFTALTGQPNPIPYQCLQDRLYRPLCRHLRLCLQFPPRQDRRQALQT